MMQRVTRRAARRIATVVAPVAVVGTLAAPGAAYAATPAPAARTTATCPPAATAVGYSDALNKAVFDGIEVGGLSAIAYDRRTRGYVTVEDHSGTQPARLFFFRDTSAPKVTGILGLTKPDGTPYDGNNFDGEGVAVLPNGNFLVSSETEPSVRVFDRKGRERGSLEVPARFQVAPAGEATVNATLEGLSISPDGRHVYAAMEGTLSGDAPATGEAVWRRILVYRAHGDGYRLTRQIGYRVDPGDRIADVAAYGDGRLLVLEAAYDAAKGNTIRLYAVRDADRATDVSKVANLSTAPSRAIVRKELVSDLVHCPTLGATSPEPQTNPLLDNYEGLQVDTSAGLRRARIHLISDDNFSAGQVTRVLTLTARLP
ncbi:esterase-like activity of phytase family protein [Actinoallomurus soli]|uniref:esterase-like activity of phytase family protein n=1 Tax=Actinoallomurus soli TaxID=2952535 RepID=UPI002093B65A|nr:esterase-like activity of phytase family protein [Actinoallomurus soli]MCO5970421.1 esterase-like activity of phytase family protein [Actinoallomurus soli]